MSVVIIPLMSWTVAKVKELYNLKRQECSGPEQIYTSVCSYADSTIYGQKEVSLVLQLLLDLHEMFTVWSTNDGVGHNM